jgi:O-acetyl-ADP-ribose deacetylase (regulator of RNase III)
MDPASSVEVDIAGRTLALVQGDITRIAADAIVNAANAGLVGGGGVDGAIHRAAGPSLMEELRSRHPGGTATGSAVVTSAGLLPARWVIHAVGPVWQGGGRGEAELLASAYRASLAHAEQLGAASVTFPAISCGVYGYPLDAAAVIAVEAVVARLAGAEPGAPLERATFVLFSSVTFDAFARAVHLARGE